MPVIQWFKDITASQINEVGGKGANLGVLSAAGIPVPPGFVTLASAYSSFISSTHLDTFIRNQLEGLDVNDSRDLARRAERIKAEVIRTNMPADIAASIRQAYGMLGNGHEYVAVRSSATAEDLPDASFAGQQSTFLNVHGGDDVVHAVQACWASLMNDRAIFYRSQQGYDHESVSLAVVVQMMVQSEKAGVMFTNNTQNGNPDQVEIQAAYGLGETVVSGSVTPDSYLVCKRTWQIIGKDIQLQDKRLVFNPDHIGGHEDANILAPVPAYLKGAQKLSDDQIIELAKLGARVELHYGGPQDIEWALLDGKFYLTQSRPVTVRSDEYLLGELEVPAEPQPIICTGQAASPGVACGRVVVLNGPEECHLIESGDILVAEMTNPDYVSAMKRAAAIVTERGGRTCHAAIVARELGVPCVVGASGAIEALGSRDIVTVDGSNGEVFLGVAEERIHWNLLRLSRIDAKRVEMESVKTKTKVMTILAEPERAIEVAAGNVDGVGLLRMEFMLARIGKHPRQFLEEGSEEEFIRQLVESFACFCAAFGDRPVVLRLTDFKTNELSNLIGGSKFESAEENPMLGLRGAARYMKYPEVFALELEAIRRVRMKHKNLWVMVPFVRTPSELEWVVGFMAEHGLQRSDEFKIWMMAEVPSNILLEKFVVKGIDGVSIGSNDLTQLILGIDRDNEALLEVGNELDEAVMTAVEHIVVAGRSLGISVGICGQAPSDYPELCTKLVEWGVTSISVSPDRVSHTRELVLAAEKKIKA